MTRGPESVINDGGTGVGVLLAFRASADVILPLAVDRLLDNAGMLVCKLDSADWRLETAVDASDWDQPQPDGKLTESPLI